jgi:hypothetical protein
VAALQMEIRAGLYGNFLGLYTGHHAQAAKAT